MEASEPAFFYTFLGTLDHPPATEGMPLTLRVSGGDEVEAFELTAHGIKALEVDNRQRGAQRRPAGERELEGRPERALPRSTPYSTSPNMAEVRVGSNVNFRTKVSSKSRSL